MRNAILMSLILVAGGCVSRTGGQLGHASFSYEECLFGCDTSGNSMAAGGAHATIQVTLNTGYSFTSVRSTNPSVATFAPDNNDTVDVTSLAPGTTTLQLIDANGTLVDETAISVEATATLAVTRGWS